MANAGDDLISGIVDAISLKPMRDRVSDLAGKAGFYFRKAVPVASPKVDTSWHDEMVRKANDSFRKRQEGRAASAQASSGKAPARKATRKRVSMKVS